MYLYETHLHTSQGSACGRSEGREYISLYRDMGYDGIFVTDHFFQGNCAAPRSGPWASRVDAYMRGYEEAKNEGEKQGLKVFFGIEQKYDDGDEYLLYGLDKAFLLAHTEIESWSREELFRQVHAFGGCVVQAHPFRDRGYIVRIHLQLSGIDAIEAVNISNKPHEDVCALKLAKALSLPVTCGSDIHGAENAVPERAGGVYLDEPLNDGRDYAKAILARRPIGLHYPPERLCGVSARMPEKTWVAFEQEREVPFDLSAVIENE